MHEEFFDILDEQGNKTGKVKSRTSVHKDGDWHRAEHIWIINAKGEILLQRRCPKKDSDPNMLDISCAGHLTSGDSPSTGAIRELKEELNLDIKESDLKYITTLKRSPKHSDDFVDNEYDDMYLLHIDKDINDLKFQKEEISEIFFVPYQKFKKMVYNRQEDLVIYEDEYQILFELLDKELNIKGDNMKYKLLKNEDTTRFNKNGVDFTGYEKISNDMSIVIEKVEKGHFEEFIHDKSTFTYLFLEGEGIFYLDDEPVKVSAGDILSINPGTRIYYYGNLKQILITTPAFDPNYERHIRDIDESVSPYYKKEEK